MNLLRGRQARWAVPAGAVAAVGMVIAGSVIARGQTAPALPARTTAQLLAAAGSPAALPPAMTAVVLQNASLGLPDLPGSSDPLSGVSLLSGSHTFRIWYDGPAKVRVAVPVAMGETDLRRDGRDVWLWDSQTNKATHYILPAGAGDAAPSVPSVPAPPQLARQILAAVGSTTTVGLEPDVTVAGQPAYQLSLAPKSRGSLIGQIRIAIAASDSLPLRVQAFARGAASPAFSVGYTSLSLARPAGSNFAFSPPPGAKVRTVTVPAGPDAPPNLPNPPAGVVPGSFRVAPLPPGSVTVRVSAGRKVVTVTGGKQLPPAVRKQLAAALAKSLPASMSKAQRATVLQTLATAPPGTATSVYGNAGQGNAAAYSSVGTFPLAGPSVIGRGWLSVAVLPSPAAARGGAGAENVLGALLSASAPVHGSWGSGRLLRTSLLSVLLLPDGRALAGAVVPSVLYADAARLR